MRKMGFSSHAANFLTLLLATTCLVVLPLDSSASPDRTDALLKRHIDALGGEKAVRAIRSIASDAEIEIMGTGLKGTVQSWSLRPCLSRSEISLGLFRVREGYDGERIWMVDPNGKLQFKRDPASLEYQKTICVIESLEYLFGGNGFELEALGADTTLAVSCEMLSVDVDGGASARLFLNDSTFLVERLEIDAPEGRAVQTYGDYRAVNGVMFPFAVRTEIPALGQRIDIRYRSIAANEPIDPVVFLPPSADARDYRFTRGSSAENVPFEYRSHHIFLSVRIGDREAAVLFLLDSGASMTVIDSSLAAEMGLASGDKMPGAGAGGMNEFSMTRIPGFAIEGIEFSEQTAVVFPIAGLLGRIEEADIGGVLGYDFLSRFATRIDYERELISFFEPDSFVPKGTEAALEAPLYHSIFSFAASVDGAKGEFLLDTGATSSVLYGAFASKMGLARGRRTLAMSIRGTGGEEGAALCRFDSLSFGGVTLKRPVLAITSSGKGIGVLENVDGIVGNDILERFTVTLDYRRQRVLLEENGRIDESFYKDRSGLQLARKRDGGIVVVAALNGSPAHGAGLRPGDIILAIGGAKASRFKSIREIMTLFEAKEGTIYTIDIARSGKKKRVALTLSEYI